jgi:hypothetical protein
MDRKINHRREGSAECWNMVEREMRQPCGIIQEKAWLFHLRLMQVTGLRDLSSDTFPLLSSLLWDRGQFFRTKDSRENKISRSHVYPKLWWNCEVNRDWDQDISMASKGLEYLSK